MGLRCSLLGHDYDESEIERDREEQGSEVVVTVREFKECNRCGERSVVSENKEVTTIERPEPAGDAVSEADDGDGGSIATEVAETDAESDRRAETEPSGSDEDDGVILDEEDVKDDAERSYGEWPEADDGERRSGDDGRAPNEWPDTAEDDQGFDAHPDDGSAADVEFGGGLTPEDAPEVDDEEVEFVDADDGPDADATTPDAEVGTGITSADDAPTPATSGSDSTLDTRLVCPECEHAQPAAESSLRVGDICPECRRGYLAEREE